MHQEQLRMQMMAGIITEGEYKAKLNENIESELSYSDIIRKIMLKLGYTQGGIKRGNLDQADIPFYYLKEFSIDDTKYSFVINAGVYSDFSGNLNLDIRLYIYRDKPKTFIQKLFSKEGDAESLNFIGNKRTKKLNIDFENPLEAKKQILLRVPSAVKSLEKETLDRISRMPDPSTLKESLNENFVGIGMVGNIFDREKEKYEDAFEHFLSERYEEKVEENYATEVRDAWPSLSIDDRVNLLLTVFDDPDMAEEMAEKDFNELPDAATSNMRMDMLEEGEGNKESELNDAVEVMFKFIDDYRTGYGGVTDSFIKKELHFFGREYSEILKDKSEK